MNYKTCDKCEGSGCSDFCEMHKDDSKGYEFCGHCKTCEACDGSGEVSIVKDEPDDDDIYRDGGMTANEHREMESIRIKNQINNL